MKNKEIKKIQIKSEEEANEIIFHPETSSEMVLVGNETLEQKLSVIDGNLSYTNELPMLSNVGGYDPGTTFDGVGLTELLTGLLYPYVSPKITLTSNQATAVREVDNPINQLTLTANVSIQSKKIQWIEFFEGSTSLKRITTNLDQASHTCLVDKTIRSSTSFHFKANDGKSTVSSNILTYNFVYPFYVGGVTSNSPGDLLFPTGDKVVKEKSNLSKTFTLDQQRFYIAYPASYGDLTSVLDTNQFEILSDFDKHAKNLTFNGQAIPYTVYIFKNLVSVSNFTVTFKF